MPLLCVCSGSRRRKRWESLLFERKKASGAEKSPLNNGSNIGRCSKENTRERDRERDGSSGHGIIGIDLGPALEKCKHNEDTDSSAAFREREIPVVSLCSTTAKDHGMMVVCAVTFV